MKKIISYTVVIAIFIGIGLGVKRYVQGQDNQSMGF